METASSPLAVSLPRLGPGHVAGERCRCAKSLGRVPAQPVGDPPHDVLGRRLADEAAPALVQDRRPPRVGEPQQVRRDGREAVGEVAPPPPCGRAGGSRRRFSSHAPAGLERVLLGRDLEREDLAQEVAGGPDVAAARRRGVLVVAGDQPPQLAVVQERDRHRRGGAHVAHVFEVDGRDAAQDGEAQVERTAGQRVAGRHERHGLVAGVRDQPQPVEPVELARLGRDVGGGETQVEVGRQGLVAVLGEHRAVPVARRSGRPAPGRSR